MVSSEYRFQKKTDKLGEEIKARHHQNEYRQYLQVKQAQAQLQFSDLALARSRAKFLRAEAIENLDTLLVDFEKKITQRGAKVHWAEQAQEAQHIIRNILHQQNNTQVIAHRAPILQEVDFEKAIQNQDIDLVYTDIHAQISRYLPENKQMNTQEVSVSSLKDIAEAIEQKDNQKIGVDAKEIFDYLQEKNLHQIKHQALGILGADFMVADTGSLCFSDNQTNIQTILGQASRHIVVVSLSQIVAKLEDLELLLSLKDGYQTGNIFSAQSFLLNAPLNQSEIQQYKNLDVIILDNGRSELYKDPMLRQALRCIHCQACAFTCPVVTQLPPNTKNFYPGVIGLVLESKTHINDNQLLTESTLCGACAEACPIEIPLHHMVRKLREEKQNNKSSLLAILNPFKAKNQFLQEIKKQYFSTSPKKETFYQQWIKQNTAK